MRILLEFPSPYSIAACGCNEDTFVDIIVGNSKSSNIDVFLEYGNNGSFVNQTIYSTDDKLHFVTVGYLNNDTKLDIVVADSGSNNLGIFFEQGDRTFTGMIRVPLEYGSRPYSVLVGDFNNDQKLNFAIANSGTDSLNIPLQTC